MVEDKYGCLRFLRAKAKILDKNISHDDKLISGLSSELHTYDPEQGYSYIEKSSVKCKIAGP